MKGRKIMKLFFVIAVSIVIIIGGILMFFKANKKMFILDGPGMINTREGEVIGVRFSCGGGMEGESLYYSLKDQGNGQTALFEYSYCPSVGADTVMATKEVSLSYLDEIRSVCRTTECLLEAHHGKQSELILLDAPVTHVVFLLQDEEIALHDSYEYGTKCVGVFSMVENELNNILKAEVKQEDLTTQGWGE